MVVGAGPGGGPVVRVFDGNTLSVVRDFLAYDATFAGGVRVAATDTDGDGRAEVITAPGPGGGPHVKGFSGAHGRELFGFMAYSPAFSGGVFVG